jgi:uncharacterized protein YxeA
MKKIAFIVFLVVLVVGVVFSETSNSRDGVYLVYDTSNQGDTQATFPVRVYNSNDYSVRVDVTVYFTNGKSSTSWVTAQANARNEISWVNVIQGYVSHITVDSVTEGFN